MSEDTIRDKGRTMKEVSEETQSAGFDKNPVPPAGAPNQPAAETEEPSLPEPKKKTPEELDEDPLEAINAEGGSF